MVDKRHSPIRRQFNESFLDPYGNFSLTKTLAIFGQIACLYQFGKHFETLIDKPESLLIVVAFIIAPELIKKLVTLKYGAAAPIAKGVKK